MDKYFPHPTSKNILQTKKCICPFYNLAIFKSSVWGGIMWIMLLKSTSATDVTLHRETVTIYLNCQQSASVKNLESVTDITVQLFTVVNACCVFFSYTKCLSLEVFKYSSHQCTRSKAPSPI